MTTYLDARLCLLAFMERNAEAIAKGEPDSDDRMTWKGEQWPPVAPAGLRAAWALDLMTGLRGADLAEIAVLEARAGRSRADDRDYGAAAQKKIAALTAAAYAPNNTKKA